LRSEFVLDRRVGGKSVRSNLLHQPEPYGSGYTITTPGQGYNYLMRRTTPGYNYLTSD
jgi:hypothetical protein